MDPSVGTIDDVGVMDGCNEIVGKEDDDGVIEGVEDGHPSFGPSTR